MWNFLRGGATVIPGATFIPESRVLWEKLLKFKAEGRDHFNNLFRQWKVRTISGNRMLFQLVPGGFSDLIDQNNYYSN